MKRSELFLSVGLVINVILFFMVCNVHGMERTVQRKYEVCNEEMARFTGLVRCGMLDSKQELSFIIQQLKEHENKLAAEKVVGLFIFANAAWLEDDQWEQIIAKVDEGKKQIKNATQSLPDCAQDGDGFAEHRQIISPLLQKYNYDVKKINFRIDPKCTGNGGYSSIETTPYSKNGLVGICDVGADTINLSPNYLNPLTLIQKVYLTRFAWGIIQGSAEQALLVLHIRNVSKGKVVVENSVGISFLNQIQLKSSCVGPAIADSAIAELMAEWARQTEHESYEIFFDIDGLWKKQKFLEEFIAAKDAK